jgi:hypothetical protein
LISILSNINEDATIWLNKQNNVGLIETLLIDLDDLGLHHVKNNSIIIDNVKHISMNILDIMNKILTINPKYVFTLENDMLIAKIINKKKPLLHEYGFNVFSQGGEDGIIEKIFSIIGTTNKVAVEFGAWDGFLNSNTANLWSNDKSWKGILIEANKDRFNQLIDNISKYNCHAILDVIGLGINSLENILKRNDEFYEEIDLLSIDIDSDDYYVFDSLTLLKSRVVVIEYNPTIPANLDIFQEVGSNVGASVFALCRIAKSKNMTLVAITTSNLFFVQNSYLQLLEEFDFSIERMKYDDQLQYFITSYSGDYAIVSSNKFIDPFMTKDTPITHLNHGNSSIITTNLGKRIVEFILTEDIVAHQVYRKQVVGIIHNHTVEYSVANDLKAGTKISLKI